MKTMDRKRFMQDDVTCAVSIHVRDGKCFLNDVMIDDKSGWCGDVEIYKNAQNITPLIRKYARDKENPKRLVRAPKLEISQEMNPADGTWIDMFWHYTGAFEMTMEEFRIFRQFARPGMYMVALTDAK